MNATHDGYVAYAEAAKFLAVSEGALRCLVSRRQIPFFKWGARVRFSIEDLRRFMETNRVDAREY